MILETILTILDVDFQKHYADPEYPLKKEWRCGSSYFGFATETELLEIEEKAQSMIDDGTMGDFIKEHNKASETGTLTVLTCTSL